MMSPGVLLESIRRWPWGALLPLLSHGSHTTAASTRPATKAAPASPVEPMLTGDDVLLGETLALQEVAQVELGDRALQERHLLPLELLDRLDVLVGHHAITALGVVERHDHDERVVGLGVEQDGVGRGAVGLDALGGQSGHPDLRVVDHLQVDVDALRLEEPLAVRQVDGPEPYPDRIPDTGSAPPTPRRRTPPRAPARTPAITQSRLMTDLLRPARSSRAHGSASRARPPGRGRRYETSRRLSMQAAPATRTNEMIHEDPVA